MRILFVVLVLSLVLFCLAEAAKEGRRKSGKNGKVQGRKGKITKKQGRRRTHKKTLKSGNAKSVARVNEVGAGCEYVVLSELTTKATDCVNGAKFVIKPGSNARRQYVIMNDKPHLLWVTKGTKFTDCTAFTDRTASISCKAVNGLAAIDLGVTGAPSTNTTAKPSSGPMTDESNDVTSTAKTSVLTTTGGITPTITDESNDVTNTAAESFGGKIGFLFITNGLTVKVDSYPCKVTLPVEISSPFVAAVLDGKIHIIGEESRITMCYTGSLESADSWEKKPKCFSSTKRGSSTVTVGQYILVSGGSVKFENTDVIERYDGKAWTPLSNKLSSPRQSHCSVAISDTEMIVLGGGGNSGRLSTMEKYDVNGNLVETLPSMNKARAELGCTIFNNELYAAGGTFSNNFNFGNIGDGAFGNEGDELLSDVEVYNFDTKTWRAISNMNFKRFSPNLHVYDGKVTAFGGGVTSIEYFDGTNWKMSEEEILEKGYPSLSVEVKCPV